MRDGEQAEVSESGKRLDAFVDAAFAFAVTLLVISGGQNPAGLRELVAAFTHAPAFAASFAFVCLFWLEHRSFGRLTARRDTAVTAMSLAIVFTVLIFVFPLRLLMEGAFGFVSGGRLPGRDVVTSWADLRVLYATFGFGYALLSLLYAGLFTLGARGAQGPARREMSTAQRIWAAAVAFGLGSANLALLIPISRVPWLPGVIYSGVPVVVFWILRSSASTTSSSKFEPPTVKEREPISVKPQRR